MSFENTLAGLKAIIAPMKVDCRKVKLPKIGWMRCKEAVPNGCEFKSVTISEHAGRWFMAFKMEATVAEQSAAKDVIGVDLGVKVFATLSTGEVITIYRQKCLQKKLVRYQRQLSRRQKGSGRRERTRQRIAAIHYRIANVRKDATHKLTTMLAKNHGTICIEDLGVKGMLKNHCLAASISASNFGAVRSQLTYKTKKFGSQLVVVDRWFPSSQICSCCSHRQKMPIHVRTYDCLKCGFSCDRDLNAAKNLAASSAVFVRPNTEVHASDGRCGDCGVKNPELLLVSNS